MRIYARHKHQPPLINRMEFISSAIYGAIAALLFLYYYKFFSRKPTTKNPNLKTPPEAGGGRLFTGHLHLLSGGSTNEELPHFQLGALADKYGPIYTIRLGVRRVLVVNSWELCKELFTTNDTVISSRPPLRVAKHLGYDNAMFGFAPYGPYWRDMRKLISLELLSVRRIELQRDVRESETNEFMKELYKYWKENKDASGRVSVELKQWFGDLNLNVILRLVAGKRFYGSGGKGADAAMTRQWREVFRDFLYLSGMFVPADALPYLGWLDLGGHEKKIKQNGKDLDRIVGGWLAEHKEKEHSGDDKAKDFMDVMLTVLQDEKFKSKYDVDTIIKTSCESLIAGGSDTTSIMLVWTLSLILNHPHVLKKVQEELDRHVGRERPMNESDINKLVYMNAVVKESLRLYPAGPLAGTRIFTEDANVGGYFVPKGTWLIPNLWKMQRDPKVWSDDVLEFKPERFLDKYKHLDVKGQDFELIPFGAGRRICPGSHLGLQITYSVLGRLLQGFEVTTSSMVDMSESAGLTNTKATPLDVFIAPRLSPDLYN
nr:cytochrome P450 CYP82D2 [Phyla nodiflora]